MGLTGYPETSVTNYQPTLRKIPEDRRFRVYDVRIYRRTEPTN